MAWKKFLRRTIGIVVCILGLFSALVPLVPGVVLVLFGLYLLSLDSPRLKRRFDSLCTCYPALLRIYASRWRLFGRRANRKDE